MPPLVDVVIPTQFRPDRAHSLVCQIKVMLNQGVDARVVLVCDPIHGVVRSFKTISDLFTPAERDAIMLFYAPDGVKGNPHGEPRGYMCAPAIKAYLESESFDHAFWQHHAADDDGTMPWALSDLLDASEGVSMVVGRAVATNRTHHDRRDYRLGDSILRCHVALSSAILKTEDIRKLDRPLYDFDSGYSDYKLIQRMADRFPYRLIDKIVNVNPLDL